MAPGAVRLHRLGVLIASRHPLTRVGAATAA
ncbi:MAG: hypothetical protein QOE11_2469, partial [Solirubrobacteraceae bacterium]|nr:hypothetical protein [Solirubrobacteraceae bacterium]